MLGKNIIANYVSQIYVTLVGILLLPLYIKFMGSEAYGLVGFFSMLQSWFGLLDLGLTPTIGREAARYHGGALSALAFRQLYRALSVIFVFVALLGGGALFGLSEIVATKWLNVESLSLNEVSISVKIMALCVALRWMCGLFRGVVTGAERLVWLSGFNALIATLRFIGVLPVMWYFGFTPFVFFVYQLSIAMVELSGLWFKAQQLLPNKKNIQYKIGWSFQPIKPILRFALSIAFTSSVWVCVTQTDKLVLSGILTLEDYGYFTLSVLVAGGITVISGPISNAIMPRMARLHAEGQHDELIRIYRKMTQLVAIITGSAAITLVVVAEPLLLAWTGDQHLASQAAPILKLYALGNGFLAIGAFPYYLQYAKGNLRYHLIGNVVMVVTLIPTIIWAASNFGGIGAGYVWLTMNALYLVIWVAYIHRKLEPGLHATWLTRDVLKIILPTILFAMLLITPTVNLTGRLESFIFVMVIGGFVIGCATVFSDAARDILKAKLQS